MSQWKNRLTTSAEVDPRSLKPNPQNWRQHPDSQREGLSNVLGKVGWVGRILVNKTTGHMIDGHARQEEAIEHGEALVPVDYVELTEEEERLVLATYDPLSAMAETDRAMLEDLLNDVGEQDSALQDMFDDMLDGDAVGGVELEDGLTDPDDTPDVEEEAVSKPGDVWVMGDHRLICGSSTDADIVSTLLAGAEPHLMITDPPYGVEYDADWRNKAMRSDGTPIAGCAILKVKNDDNADWSEAWALFQGDVAYVWHAGIKSHVVALSLEKKEFEMRALICWGKNNFAISRGHYHHQHEPCWYAVRNGKTGYWVGDRKQTTLWSIPKPQKSETGHSTQKPIECMLRPILNNSNPGDAVYEPFSGSGTTIIAAEQSSRSCYAVELHPQYVDMAVRRWQNFTGKAAVLESSGQAFCDVEQEAGVT